MSPILLIILVLGALLTLLTGVAALRAGVRAFVAQADLRKRLDAEMQSLSLRAGELEVKAARLQEQGQEMPVRVERIQENLATLRVLTHNLYVSINQTRRALSYSGLVSSGTSRLSRAARRYARSAREGSRG